MRTASGSFAEEQGIEYGPVKRGIAPEELSPQVQILQALDLSPVNEPGLFVKPWVKLY